jgi:gliding motility-associated-like protein
MKYLHYLSIVFFLLISLSLSAQSVKLNDRLQTYFSFDNYPIVDKSGNSVQAFMQGDSSLSCGVEGQALRSDGLTSGIVFFGNAIFDVFKQIDFTMSFYLKTTVQGGNQTFDVFSKRVSCTSDSSFAIRYTPSNNSISVELVQDAKLRHIVVQRLDPARCWQHIVITRNFNTLKLYVNGRLRQSNVTTKRVNISNNKTLTFANGTCTTDRKFKGLIDELRIYDRAVNEDEVAALYTAPDQVENRDTIIFLGANIPTRLTNTCVTDFSWLPKDDIADPKSGETVITPTKGGQFKYILTMKDGANCTILDTINVKVVDPKDLDCTKLFVPNAFTPNGNGINEKFYISNPETVDEIVSFEVLDAWGGRMYYTKEKRPVDGGWDGTFNGTPVNPQVFLWKARYKCKGQELSQFGSVTLIK